MCWLVSLTKCFLAPGLQTTVEHISVMDSGVLCYITCARMRRGKRYLSKFYESFSFAIRKFVWKLSWTTFKTEQENGCQLTWDFWENPPQIRQFFCNILFQRQLFLNSEWINLFAKGPIVIYLSYSMNCVIQIGFNIRLQSHLYWPCLHFPCLSIYRGLLFSQNTGLIC